jgi:hypothetical protein
VTLHAPVRRRGAYERAWPAPAPPPARALGPPRGARHPQAFASGVPIDLIVILLACLALVLMNAIPTTLLTLLKIHYVSTGGAAYEKFHPATYVSVLAFCVLLLRGGGPVAELDRMISQAPLMLLYAFSILLVLIQSVVLGRPVTSAVDTFVLPILVCLVVWSLSVSQRRPLVWTLHVLMIVNIGLGYFEYLSGHRIVPLAVGDQILTDEWRSTALFGHPLRAAGLVGAYTLALMLRPSLCRSLALRAPLILLCIGSLFVFGGRTALVMVLATVALLGAWAGFRLLRGARTPLPVVLAGICGTFLVAAAALTLYDVGFLDKMMLRFTADNGSAYARVEALNLLTSLDARDLIFGSEAPHIDSLQSLYGIRVGIEDFWIACIAQYGLIATVLLTIGLGCFFAELLRRSHRAATALMVFLVIIAASSVSFSAKSVMLAQYVLIILLLLAKDEAARPARLHARAAKVIRPGVPRAWPR